MERKARPAELGSRLVDAGVWGLGQVRGSQLEQSFPT